MGSNMGDSFEALIERAIINLQFARAEAALPATTRQIQQILAHIDMALVDLIKLAPRYDTPMCRTAGY